MPNINNIDDYWEVVDTFWDGLLSLIYDKLDSDHMTYAIPGDNTTPETGRKLFEELEYLKTTKDPKLEKYFSYTWATTSEVVAREAPFGWNALCDLCSEVWVFYDDSEQDADPAF